MRIVIDMQGAQTESRFRGIGRYTLSLAQGIARNRGEHELILAVSGLFPDTIEPIRAAFDGLLPQENIRVWYAPGPVRECEPGNEHRREAAELIREAFLASLSPDVVHLTSLFEGYVDDAVTSMGRFASTIPVSVTVHDLMPLLNPDHYLQPNPDYKRYYLRKVDHLRKAALLLTISEHSRTEAISSLRLDGDRVVNTSSSADSRFRILAVSYEQRGGLLKRYDIHRPILYTGGTDKRKKLLRLIQAYGRLPEHLRGSHQDLVGRQAVEAFEQLVTGRERSADAGRAPGDRPTLAFVSPLPPQRTGVAQYSAELLPELERYYDIELVADQSTATGRQVWSQRPVRGPDWLRANAHRIDRVLYQFGNSPFHQHMLALLDEIPGTVVLHDFFLSGLYAYMEEQGGVSGAWVRALYHSHGYPAVRERFRAGDTGGVQMKYPANLAVLERAQGVIVHAGYSKALASHWFGAGWADDWVAIPHLRTPHQGIREEARRQLGIGVKDFLVCSFGFLGPTKLNHRLLSAWLASSLAADRRCSLVFVGENHGGDYGAELLETIRRSPGADRIQITGWADADTYRSYLAAADLAVQLRTLSRGESSGTVLDCMNQGVATVVNANGAMGELPTDAVWMLPDEFEQGSLREALEILWRDDARRSAIGSRARSVIRERHAPDVCAMRYAEAIEGFHARARTGADALVEAIAGTGARPEGDAQLAVLAQAVAQSLPGARPARQLLVDVSATCRNDLKTGIERVARAVTMALLESPPPGYRIEPVYLSEEGGRWHYRYARRFTLNLLECEPEALVDEIVEPHNGDLLLGVDLSGDVLVNADAAGLLQAYRDLGVTVYFMVHDLLPLLAPQFFPPGADETYARWLSAVCRYDGIVCVSRTVERSLRNWLEDNGVQRHRPLRIGWSHHGADLVRSAPSHGLPDNAQKVLAGLAARPTFLMVGTIEPRKGHLQTIEAFDRLWQEGYDVNLVIVGKEGWTDLPDEMRRVIPQTVQRLRAHSELGGRLLWLDGISDEYLEKVYEAAGCLIAASYDEGYGLPLIEAAQHGLPIIARDIPVFREVVGNNAHYFSGDEPLALAEAIRQWLILHERGQAPSSKGLMWLTWAQSAQRLLDRLLPERRPAEAETRTGGSAPAEHWSRPEGEESLGVPDSSAGASAR